MGSSDEDVAALQKRVRVLEQRVERSEQQRARLEDVREKHTRLMRLLSDETHEAQRALEQRNHDLETLARELRVSEERARAASAAKSVFLANVSHELRTPLSGIIGIAQVLLRAPLREADRGLVRTLMSSGEALLELINDILDVTRVETGKMRLDREDLSPREVVSEVIDLLQGEAAGRELPLVASVEDDVPARVLGDAGRLRQILLNLVGNALKFTERGDVSVRLFVHSRSPTRVLLVFEVRDTGIGIAPKELASLFRPFSQVDPSSSRRYRGSGLGLYISRELARLMGGDIDVDSVVKEGSIFRVTLPFEELAGHEAEAVPAAPVSAASDAPLGLRVLVAEDDPTSALVARLLLELIGCEGVVVADGNDVVTRVASDPFDAVLMDCHMPTMDGYEATRRIRALAPPAGAIPIVAVTADARPSERERCFAAGMSDYLAKPLRTEELRAALASARSSSSSLLS